MLIIVVGINLPRSKYSRSNWRSKFPNLNLYFSYREFHEFCTKTINDNYKFSIDEKETVSITFESNRKKICFISIYALLR